MSDWFRQFHHVLQGEPVSDELKLIPAGTASMEDMLQHVRYQFSSKVRESTEETFPKSIKRMGEEKWDELWSEFKRSSLASPRSLDDYPLEFLKFVQASDAPHALKELMRFEWAIETHPWSFQRLSKIELPQLALTEELKIELAPLDIQQFSAPVLALYEGYEVFADYEPHTVILWLTDEGMRFRRLDEWEVSVLQNLGVSLGHALQYAPEDSQAISEFFQWLGSSGLILRLS